jgi:hypothetical protein
MVEGVKQASERGTPQGSPLAETADGRVIGPVVGRDDPKGDVFGQSPLDLARAPDALRICIEEQCHHHRWVKGGPSPAVVAMAIVETREVDLAHRLDDHPREVIVGEPIGETRRHQKGLVSIGGDKVLGHDRLLDRFRPVWRSRGQFASFSGGFCDRLHRASNSLRTSKQRGLGPPPRPSLRLTAYRLPP